MIKVKVCCISSVEEAALAVRYGAAALGLVSEMPSGPGVIDENVIAAIVPTVPPGVSTFLLTSKEDSRAIMAQQRRCGCDTLQLCSYLPPTAYGELRAALPGISLVQVIHVTGEEALTRAVAVAPYVDMLLLDSGNLTLPVKELGGTGRTHDWHISRQIRQAVGVPVYLAGGLHAANVAAAVAQVRPYGVDICSGLRSGGRLDENKVQAFFGAVRALG